MIYNIANKMIKYANGNNYSSNYSVEDIRNFMEKIFKTKTGIELLKSIHQV